jgi:hypothetical protein
MSGIFGENPQGKQYYTLVRLSQGESIDSRACIPEHVSAFSSGERVAACAVNLIGSTAVACSDGSCSSAHDVTTFLEWRKSSGLGSQPEPMVASSPRSSIADAIMLSNSYSRGTPADPS